MSVMQPEEMTVLELVADHGIACELGRTAEGCDHEAKWVMFRAAGVCDCGSRPPALACEDCKEQRIHSEGAVFCQYCGVAIAPARLGYSRIEAI